MRKAAGRGAIIAVLVAISIPIFTSQLEKAREATDKADIRDYYAEITTVLLTDDWTASNTCTVGGTLTAEYDEENKKVTVASWTPNQTDKGWIGGDPEIAGVTVTAPCSKSSTTSIVYTFDEDADGDLYLKTITFGSES